MQSILGCVHACIFFFDSNIYAFFFFLQFTIFILLIFFNYEKTKLELRHPLFNPSLRSSSWRGATRPARRSSSRPSPGTAARRTSSVSRSSWSCSAGTRPSWCKTPCCPSSTTSLPRFAAAERNHNVEPVPPLALFHPLALSLSRPADVPHPMGLGVLRLPVWGHRRHLAQQLVGGA